MPMTMTDRARAMNASRRARELAHEYDQVEHEMCSNGDRGKPARTNFDARHKVVTIYCSACGETIAHHYLARPTP